MFLDKSTFSQVIDATPLISIDLVIQNSQGQILLGLRNNKPAQGYWFVPGGRIQKNETLDKAFARLCLNELGVDYQRQQATLLGPYEHFYDDYVFGDEISTHYVVLGYHLKLDIDLENLPNQQHNQYKWFTPEQIRQQDSVHMHSKWYINDIKTTSDKESS